MLDERSKAGREALWSACGPPPLWECASTAEKKNCPQITQIFADFFASHRRQRSGRGLRGEQHASPSEAPRGMKMKLVDACLSLSLTRLIFSSIFESAHASRVLAAASRRRELPAIESPSIRVLVDKEAGSVPRAQSQSGGGPPHSNALRAGSSRPSNHPPQLCHICAICCHTCASLAHCTGPANFHRIRNLLIIKDKAKLAVLGTRLAKRVFAAQV